MALYSKYFVVEIFGIIIAIACAAYLYMKYVAFDYWSSRNIPFVKPVVPFGSMSPLLFGKVSIGQFFHDVYLEFKKSLVVGIYSFHKPILLVNDPDLIRFVLTKEFVHFHDRGVYSNESIDPLTGNLFMLGGERWRYLRTKFTPTFTSSKIKQMFFTVKENSEKLAIYMEKKAANSEVIEIKDLMARYTTDTIASTAFGVECNSIDDPNAEFRKWGRKFFEPQLMKNSLAMLAPELLKLFKISFVRPEVTDFFINSFKANVEYRTAHNMVRKDFLDLVMQLMNKGYIQDDEEQSKPVSEYDTKKITMHEGVAQAFVFWVAGFETSSSTAAHCLYELALNQDIQDKVADEINTVLGKSGDLTYESLKEMRYLDQTVSETLRKYPPVPMLNRKCAADIDLPGTGLRLAEGTPIVIPIYGIHMDPDIYPDPEIFDPERFTPENISSRHQYTYLPFGEGPRNCIGMRFGLVQTKVGLVSLLTKYRFTPGPNIQVPIKQDTGNVIFTSLGGIELQIKHR